MMSRTGDRILLSLGGLTPLLAATLVSAATIVVDLSDGGHAITIQAAVGLAAAGDTVLVLPGVYAENIILASGVTLRSRDGFTDTIIDGQGGKCVEARRCAAGTRVVGFTLTNGGSFEGGGVAVFDNTEIEIAHNLIINHKVEFGGAGVWVQRHSHAMIHHNRFENTSSHLASAIAVIVYSSADIRHNEFVNNESEAHGAAIGAHESHLVVVDNFFLNNRSGGDSGTVDFFKSAGQVFNNTFIGNSGGPAGASALAIRDDASMVSVARNLFVRQTGGPALLTETCQPVSCNIFWENETDHGGVCPPIDQDGNIVADPALISEFQGRVAPDSPCMSLDCGHVGNLAVSGCAQSRH